jgi:hypothetical protein
MGYKKKRRLRGSADHGHEWARFISRDPPIVRIENFLSAAELAVGRTFKVIFLQATLFH